MFATLDELEKYVEKNSIKKIAKTSKPETCSGSPAENKASEKWNNCIGVVEWESGQKYEGELKNGDRHFLGTMWFPIEKSYSKYEGEFVRGSLNGEGKLYFRDKSYYEGGFKNNKYNGFGKRVFANGNTLIGDFKRR